MEKRSDELEQIRLFVATLINEEQNLHSILIESLKDRIGGTKDFTNVCEILTKIYEAKIQTLDKVYKKIQDLQ